MLDISIRVIISLCTRLPQRILVDLGRSSQDPDAYFADNARARAALAGLGSLCAATGDRVLGVPSVAELLVSSTSHPGGRETVAAGAPALAGALVAGITSTCALGQAPSPAALLLLARLLYPGFGGGHLSGYYALGAEELCRLAETGLSRRRKHAGLLQNHLS